VACAKVNGSFNDYGTTDETPKFVCHFNHFPRVHYGKSRKRGKDGLGVIPPVLASISGAGASQQDDQKPLLSPTEMMMHAHADEHAIAA
jgi:hypothetical protein